MALPALAATPDSPALLAVLGEAYLALGDAHSALAFLDRAIVLEPRGARLYALRGDALLVLEDIAGARRDYTRSLELARDPAIEHKLAGLPQVSAARLLLRYDGGINAPLGDAVLRVLGAAYDEFAQRLAFRPGSPVTVVLQTEAEFADSRVPAWAEGINDGTIRVPVHGLEGPTPRLTRVLRHELAHSFLSDRTGGNCPAWLQEGVSQWLEGGDPGREDARLAPLARARELAPLLSLEGPFAALPEERASLAYAQSLAAVGEILRRHGEPGLARLLAVLGDGLPSERALPAALGVDYPGLQQGLEAHLRSVR